MKYRSKISSALLIALFACDFTLQGCTKDVSEQGGSSDDQRELGNLALDLALAPGVSVESVRYQITGNDFFREGTVDVASAAQFSLFVAGIPTGQGYTIALEALGAGDVVLCTGSATFEVVADRTTTVSVALNCQLPDGTGGVLVDATTNLCPRLSELTVTPTSAAVGGTITLLALATDLDDAPSAVSYAWTSTLGTVSDASSPSARVVCTSPGEGSASLTYSDGACSRTFSAPVRCDDVDAGTGGDAGSPDGGLPTPGQIRISEWMYDGTGGEFVELTNVGGRPVDLTGYSFDDDSALPGVFSLSGFGVVQPGESVVFTESTVESFRGAWSLCAGVKLLGGYTNNLGRNDQINIFDASGALVDRLTYGDQTFPGSIRTTGASGWVSPAGSGADDPYAWTLSTVGDAEGSYASAGNAVASPGKSTLGSAYDPCGSSAPDAGTPNADGGAPGPDAGTTWDFEAWPGSAEVIPVDAVDTFTGDLSGLTYEPATASTPARLWAVENGASLLFRLELQGGAWLPSTEANWGAGKELRYPDGTGRPDSEGLTKAEWSSSAVYVATERNNAASGTSRPSILRFDTLQLGTTLNASHEWSLVSDLPLVGANLGPETITWIPDDFLVARGFHDEATGALYAPAQYPGHGSGLFFVGLEANGIIYAYALDHAQGGAATRVATIESGFPGLMGMEFDRDVGQLWAHCDDTCGNRATVLGVDDEVGSPTRGRFVIRRGFERPAGLPDANNEGFAVAPELECVGGQKSVFWSDDDDTDGHSLRRGSLTCGAL